MTSGRLVSVVIPAYNAEATLGATLASARAQLHEALEIIVVDDGSTDATLRIAKEHASVDPRVRTLHQANAGLAAARNAGWRQARSDLIAFLDADDLWAPTKILRQVEAFEAGGAQVGLVYCNSVRIDAFGAIKSHLRVSTVEGDVLEAALSANFIGNGSAAMVTREALVHVEGYDSSLQAAGAQGCEDYLLQCRIAEKFHFAVAPEYLVGYRYLPGNMSSDRPRMLRSWILVVEQMRRRQPQRTAALHKGLRTYTTWLLYDAVGKRAFAQLPEILKLIRRYPLSVWLPITLKDVPGEAIKRLLIRAATVLRSESASDARPDAGFFPPAPTDKRQAE